MTIPLHSRHRSRGFSLVELLVVVAILALLMGLLIPAIQALRDAAMKTQNQNNIRQIMIAVNNYAAQNNGLLPAGGDWGSNAGYTGTILTPESLLLQQKFGAYTTDATGAYIEDPAKTRTDWVDGPVIFRLFPYMDYANIYVDSYGPMLDGNKVKGFNYPDQFHFNQTYNSGDAVQATAWLDSHGKIVGDPNDPNFKPDPSTMTLAVLEPFRCTGSHVAGKTFFADRAYWEKATLLQVVKIWHADNRKTAKINYGHQACRNPVRLKGLTSAGDPTANLPGIDAPLSYPVIGRTSDGSSLGGRSIETLSASTTAYVTEAFAACGYNLTHDFPVGYLSWASGTSVDQDTVEWTYPADRSIAFITSPVTSLDYRVYLGLGVGNPPCPPGYSSGSRCGALQVASCTAPTDCVSDGTDSRPSCHCGEFYVTQTIKVNTRNFFDDKPTAWTCRSSVPQSMIKGSIDVGFIDGSVRGLTPDVDRRVLLQMMADEASTSDPIDF